MLDYCSLYRKVLLVWCSMTLWEMPGSVFSSLDLKNFICFVFLQVKSASYIKCLPLFDTVCSSIDEAAKEKLAPFSTLSGDESYQNRDLEKVHLRSWLLKKWRCFFLLLFIRHPAKGRVGGCVVWHLRDSGETEIVWFLEPRFLRIFLFLSNYIKSLFGCLSDNVLKYLGFIILWKPTI